MLALGRIWLTRSLTVAGLLLSFVGVAEAQFPMPLGHLDQSAQPENIRELVSKYCRLDYEGARLNPQGWDKVQSLVWWKSNPDAAQISVITRYTVSSTPELEHGKYTVTVHYLQMGRFDPAIGYTREPSTDDVEFTVTSSNEEWKIYDVSPNFPHISKPAMVTWLNAKAAGASDDATKKIYQNALRQLQPPAAPPAQ